MGIKNGAPDIIRIIRCGLYNKRAKNYKIIVDGELMRYKGMVENNLSKHNAEEAIAALSFDYMKNLIDQIERFIGTRAVEIVIFMDGCRVFNKESGRADFRFDASLIRMIFKGICFEYGYTVNELTHGESELQMYLQRDKTMDLNVFLTNDSDMISICYGHTPILKYKVADDSQTEGIEYQQNNLDAMDWIVDQNCIYNLTKVNVTDSCVWINSGKTVTAIGFDHIETRVKFNTFIFRIFIALCGTDFTPNLLTDSMITGIILAEPSDIDFMNSLTDIHDIACCLLMIGLRAGGTLKRFDEKAKSQIFNADDVEKSIRMYLEYIETGKMENVTIPRACMSLVCRHYLYAMKGQDNCFVKNTLTTWAKKTTLSEAIKQMKKYLGTYNPALCDRSATKQSRKRKCDDSDCVKINNNPQTNRNEIPTQSNEELSVPTFSFTSKQKTVLDEL